MKREGRRKVGGCCRILVGLRSCFSAGRSVVDVDILDGGRQWRGSDLFELLVYNLEIFPNEVKVSRSPYYATADINAVYAIHKQHLRFHLTSVTQELTSPILKFSEFLLHVVEMPDASTCFGSSAPLRIAKPTTPITNQRPSRALRGGNVGKALHEIRSLGKRACPPSTDWINRVIITGHSFRISYLDVHGDVIIIYQVARRCGCHHECHQARS